MFSIQTEHLKAVVIFAAKGDVREYLNGVCVDVDKAGNVRLVGSDGHRLAVMKGWSLAEPLAGLRFILDGDAMREIAKSKAADLVVVPGNDGYWMVGDRRVKLLDYEYPFWKRVIPHFDDMGDQTPATFNPMLLKTFADASKILTGKVYNVEVYQRGTNGGSVVTLSGRDDFMGVIMPLRGAPSYPPSESIFGWVMA